MPTSLRLLPVFFLLFLPGCALWQGDEPPPPPPELAVAPEQQLPYTVTLTAAGEQTLDDDLQDLLEASSQLFRLEDEPPPGLPGLQRRAELDRAGLAKALRSEGYYDAALDIAIAEGSPARVTVTVSPGTRYKFGEIRVVAKDGVAPPELAGIDDIGLEPGAPARGPAVDAARRQLVRELAERGYPFARSDISDGDFVLDRQAKTLGVVLPVAAGAQARLGDIRIQGLETVPESYVRNRVPWQPGEIYSPERVEKLRGDLARRDLFASVRVDVGRETGPDGTVPITVIVGEKEPRFIGLGAGYSTSDGAYASAEWGHRNLFGGAERFDIEGRVGGLGAQANRGIDYELRSTLDIPDFQRPDQSLIFDGLAALEHPEAYDRRAFNLGARVERTISEELTLGAGIVLERSTIQRPDEPREDYNLIGVPALLRRDTTDSLLDPTEGTRLRFTVTPYAGIGGDGGNFVLTRADGSAYWARDENARYVLAGRAALGTILGGREQAPPDKRFYAGGGGSVRGYGYQGIGPLDARGNPVGGRSLVELGAEARIRVGENWGVVPFIDAGAVSGDSYPGSGTDLAVGAGLGVRYYTGFGPIRADFAVPLNRRGDDDAIAFYISLGQAF